MRPLHRRQPQIISKSHPQLNLLACHIPIDVNAPIRLNAIAHNKISIKRQAAPLD
jgi:hypothetical protein